jgi:hypothetical protein
MSQQQKDAAALVYMAARLASAVASLDLEFRTLRDKINKLDPGWISATSSPRTYRPWPPRSHGSSS